MSCQKLLDKPYDFVECGEFLFINKQSNYEDSINICKNHGYELAYINIMSGLAVETGLKENTYKQLNYFQLNKEYYRVGLRFLYENGTWRAKWSNGVFDDVLKIDDVRLVDSHKNDNCYDVLIYKNMKDIFRVDCNRSDVFLCRKPTIINETKSTEGTIHPPTTTSTTFTASSGNYDVTSPSTTISNQNNASLLIGLSVAFSVIFLIAVILLAYICFNKRKQEDKNKLEKSQNVAASFEAGQESVDELKNNDVTYMEISEYKKSENVYKEVGNNEVENNEVVDENETVQLSANEAVYTMINKIKKPDNEVTGENSNDAVYTVVNKNKKVQNNDNIV